MSYALADSIKSLEVISILAFEYPHFSRFNFSRFITPAEYHCKDSHPLALTWDKKMSPKKAKDPQLTSQNFTLSNPCFYSFYCLLYLNLSGLFSYSQSEHLPSMTYFNQPIRFYFIFIFRYIFAMYFPVYMPQFHIYKMGLIRTAVS